MDNDRKYFLRAFTENHSILNRNDGFRKYNDDIVYSSRERVGMEGQNWVINLYPVLPSSLLTYRELMGEFFVNVPTDGSTPIPKVWSAFSRYYDIVGHSFTLTMQICESKFMDNSPSDLTTYKILKTYKYDINIGYTFDRDGTDEDVDDLVSEHPNQVMLISHIHEDGTVSTMKRVDDDSYASLASDNVYPCASRTSADVLSYFHEFAVHYGLSSSILANIFPVEEYQNKKPINIRISFYDVHDSKTGGTTTSPMRTATYTYDYSVTPHTHE